MTARFGRAVVGLVIAVLFLLTPSTTPAQTAAQTVAVATTTIDLATTGDDQSLPEFLVEDLAHDRFGGLGRVLGLVGTTVMVGFLVFAVSAFRGTRRETVELISVARAGGICVGLGALIELLGRTGLEGVSLSDVFGTSFGSALMMRVAGGTLACSGLVPTVPNAAKPNRAVRWAPDRRSYLGLGGVALVVLSYCFDGHTVTQGFRPVHAVLDATHVIAGSTWVGGVVAMAVVMWRRYRSGRSVGALGLVMRFSSVAIVALGFVAFAGAIMAWMVLDSFGDLTSTPWGRVLLLKIAVVVAAAGVGAFNHFRMLPMLEHAPHDSDVIARVRSMVTAEAILLLFVVVVTATLVSLAA
jgi:copper transport protein